MNAERVFVPAHFLSIVVPDQGGEYRDEKYVKKCRPGSGGGAAACGGCVWPAHATAQIATLAAMTGGKTSLYEN